jgi:hypothetical protein
MDDMQDTLLPLRGELVDLHLDGADNVETEGLLAVGEEDFVLLVLTQLADAGELVEILVGDPGEEMTTLDNASDIHGAEV